MRRRGRHWVSVAFTVDDRAGGCRCIAGGGSASEVEVAAPFEEDLEGGRHDLGAPRAVGGHLERGAGVGLRRGNEDHRRAVAAEVGCGCRRSVSLAALSALFHR